MIKSLTSLRGIFILFIFLHHAGLYPGGGTMAVAFFFVLSGFSMTLGYREKVFLPDFSYKQYLVRRGIKFYPLHWITLLVDIPLVLMSTLFWWLVPVFFVNAALLQTLVPVEEVYFSYNAVSWFLADILFFAVLFPFLLKGICRSTTKKRIALFALLMVLYGVLAWIVPTDFRHAVFYISPYVRILDFIFGILLGLCYLDIRTKRPSYNIKRWLPLAAVCILILLLVAESYFLNAEVQLFAPVYWPLVAMLILCAALPQNGELRILENRILIRLGECSFTIFLVHRLVLRYMALLVGIDNVYLNAAVCLLLTILISLLIDRFILTPVSQWLRRKLQPSTTAQ